MQPGRGGGGQSRGITIFTAVVHFLHPMLCIGNYLYWVRNQDGSTEDRISLGTNIRRAYLALSIIAFFSFLLLSSCFYYWAWRLPEPEEIAKRRRIYGVASNLLLSDFPMFIVEIQIIWNHGMKDVFQGVCFVFTCISLLYSGLRMWLFLVVKVTKNPPRGGPPIGSREGSRPGSRAGAAQFDRRSNASVRLGGDAYDDRQSSRFGDTGRESTRGFPRDDRASSRQGPISDRGSFDRGGDTAHSRAASWQQGDRYDDRGMDRGGGQDRWN